MFSKEPLFQEGYDNAEDYALANIRGYEPMTAKELDTEEKQNDVLSSKEYFIEEKFDGTRALVYFFSQPLADEEISLGYARVFSRRISKKTGFYVENTDSVPNIREINVPELEGTILDGEMFIPNNDFETSCGIMNSKYDRAIARQEEIGWEVFHAFDILFYHGIDLRKMPLHRRKVYLHYAVEEANSQYIEEVVYQKCGQKVSTLDYEKTHGNPSDIFFNMSMFHKNKSYPHFYEEVRENETENGIHELSPRALYEYLVYTGGEGVIIKPVNGKYLHKRGWEYSKIKKFLTREMIIIGYEDPETEYKGKFPDPTKWDYWEDYEGDIYNMTLFDPKDRSTFINNVWNKDEFAPVTKFHAMNWIGNLKLGILITKEEYDTLNEKKRGAIIKASDLELDSDDYIMEVCVCAGYDEEVRQYITENQEELLGTTVEIKAQQVFKDSGKLRHPRFLRFREDKSPEQCIWKDHISD